MKLDLSIKIGNVKFCNPVTVCSGTFLYIKKYYSIKQLRQLGALVPKTITLHPREGNPPPRIVETPAGMVNAIGIGNKGIEYFLKEEFPFLQKIGIPIIISVSGKNKREFIQLVERVNNTGASCVELNLSCPNLRDGRLVAQDAKATYRIVKAVKSVSEIPVIAKLTPNVTDITEIATACEDAGADAVSMVNTFMAMVIDVDKRVPVLGNVSGGLSGPAIRPIAVYMVYKTARKIKIPIIAMGGVMDAADALQFLIAGASMVAVGTANFINPNAPIDVLKGIKEYMRKKKIKGIKYLWNKDFPKRIQGF